MKIVTDRDSGTRWMKEYGKVFGVYEGTKPVLAVADPDVLGQICIKDFNYFPNHAHVEISSELTRSFIFSGKNFDATVVVVVVIVAAAATATTTAAAAAKSPREQIGCARPRTTKLAPNRAEAWRRAAGAAIEIQI